MVLITRFTEVIRKIVSIIDNKQKKKSLIAFLCILIESILSLLSVAIILPFFYILLEPQKYMNHHMIRPFVELLGIKTNLGLFILLSLLVIIIYVIKTIGVLITKYQIYKYSSTLQGELAVEMFSSYMKRPYSYFVNINSADILQGIGNDVNGVFYIINNVMLLITNVLTFVLISIMLLIVSFKMALVFVIAGGLGAFLIFVVLKRKISYIGQRSVNSKIQLGKSARQALDGIKEITVMQRRALFLRAFEDEETEAVECDKWYSFYNSMPTSLLELLFIFVLLGAVFVEVISGDNLNSSIPQLGTFAISAAKLLPCIVAISSSFNSIIFYKPSLERVFENITIARNYNKTIEHKVNSSKNLTFNYDLCINNIVFGYDNKTILDDVSLTIKNGDAIAIIGESGSGKTTLADIILGLYKPSKGYVLSDGDSIYDNLGSWSKIIGFVPQTVFLLDDTIRNNVLFGSKCSNDEDVWDSIRRAQLEEYVKNLPEGLDTIVGERGIKLSGGQRQRIAIARALYNNPQILIFDEATAALDNETESALMDSINSLIGSKTLIIIAHRLSTIEKCNKVYEVCDGKIKQRL